MREYNFFVYLMASCRNGTLYCGVTNDLVRRVVEHREGRAAGFTAKYGVSRLVWFEQHTDIKEAILREKRMKTWNREWKLNLIERDNRECGIWRLIWGWSRCPTVIPAKAGIQNDPGASVQKTGSPPSRG